jgi:hypothetical protein
MTDATCRGWAGTMIRLERRPRRLLTRVTHVKIPNADGNGIAFAQPPDTA